MTPSYTQWDHRTAERLRRGDVFTNDDVEGQGFYGLRVLGVKVGAATVDVRTKQGTYTLGRNDKVWVR